MLRVFAWAYSGLNVAGWVMETTGKACEWPAITVKHSRTHALWRLGHWGLAHHDVVWRTWLRAVRDFRRRIPPLPMVRVTALAGPSLRQRAVNLPARFARLGRIGHSLAFWRWLPQEVRESWPTRPRPTGCAALRAPKPSPNSLPSHKNIPSDGKNWGSVRFHPELRCVRQSQPPPHCRSQQTCVSSGPATSQHRAR